MVALQLLTAEERDFPFAGGHRFVDPETGAVRCPVTVRRCARGFLARFAAAQAALGGAAGSRRGVRLATSIIVDEPLDTRRCVRYSGGWRADAGRCCSPRGWRRLARSGRAAGRSTSRGARRCRCRSTSPRCAGSRRSGGRDRNGDSTSGCCWLVRLLLLTLVALWLARPALTGRADSVHDRIRWIVVIPGADARTSACGREALAGARLPGARHPLRPPARCRSPACSAKLDAALPPGTRRSLLSAPATHRGS